MKNPLFFLLMLALFVGACKDDDDNQDEPIFSNAQDIINHDGVNFSAPVLPPGQYEMSAFFPGSSLTQYQGKFLRDVAVYLTNVPAATQIVIYGTGQNGAPGDVLYEANVGGAMVPDSWNAHRLSSAIEITGEDLWLTIYVDHRTDSNDSFGSVGCDAGPANTNGDKIFDFAGGSWTTFRDYSSGESDINWNIRGNITD